MLRGIVKPDDVRGIGLLYGPVPETDIEKIADMATEAEALLKLAQAEAAKATAPEVLAYIPQMPNLGLMQTMKEIKQAFADMGKDISLTSPLSTGFVPFDLEEPSKKIFPVLTPLRNRIPRSKGQGTARRYKRITAISGSDTGAARINPFIAELPSSTWANLTLARPPKVAWVSDDQTVTYKFQGLSEQVSFGAQWAGIGFEDIRATAALNLLRSVMMGEELGILGGRITALAQPTITLAARDAVTGETGITGTGTGGTNVYVKVTTQAVFGEGAASAVANVNIAEGATKVVDVTVGTTGVAGALGYYIYANKADTGGADPGDGSRYRQGRSGYYKYTIQGPLATSGTLVPTSASDYSANAYDGLLTQLAGSAAGYHARLNASLNSDLRELDTLFRTLWDNYAGDPDELWGASGDITDIGQLLVNMNPGVYRLMYTPDQQGGVVGGIAVRSILNKITQKEVKLSVHRYIPQGNLLALSYSLPFPWSEVPNVMEIVNVQDYLELDWPVIQMSYDMSVILFGALVLYAPAYGALLSHIKPR